MNIIKEVKEDKDKEALKKGIEKQERQEKQGEDKKSQLWVQRRRIPLSNPVESLKGTNRSEPLSPGYT